MYINKKCAHLKIKTTVQKQFAQKDSDEHIFKRSQFSRKEIKKMK